MVAFVVIASLCASNYQTFDRQGFIIISQKLDQDQMLEHDFYCRELMIESAAMAPMNESLNRGCKEQRDHVFLEQDSDLRIT